MPTRFRLLPLAVLLLPLGACSEPTGLDDGYPVVRGTYLLTSDFRVQENSCGEELGNPGHLFMFMGDSSRIEVTQNASSVWIGQILVKLSRDGTFKSDVDDEFGTEREWSDGRWIDIQYVMHSWTEGKFAKSTIELRIAVAIEGERPFPSIGSDRCRLVVVTAGQRAN